MPPLQDAPRGRGRTGARVVYLVTTVAFQSSDLSQLLVPVLSSSSASASSCRRRNIESQLFQTKVEEEAKQLRKNNKIENAAIQRFTMGYNKLCKNCPTRLQPRVETLTEMIMGLSKDDRTDLLAAVSQRQQHEQEQERDTEAERSKMMTSEERSRRHRRECSSGLRTPEEVYHFQVTGDVNVNVNHTAENPDPTLKSLTSSSSIQQFQKSLIRNEIEWEEKEGTQNNNMKKSSSSAVVESNKTKGTYHTTTHEEDQQQRIIITNSNNNEKKKKKQQKIMVKMDKNKVKLRKSKNKLIKINSLLKVVTLLLASSSSSKNNNNNNNTNNNNSNQQIISVRDNTLSFHDDDNKEGYENYNNEHNDDENEEEIQKLYLLTRSELKLQYLQYTSQKMKYERSRAKSRVKCYSASLQLLSKR